MNFFILEDNRLQSLALQNLLNELYDGCKITACSNLTESLDILANNSFDILLLDIEIDNLNSIVFFERVTTMRPELSRKIIFITAHQKYAMDAINRTHCFGYLEKPYSKEKLAELIGECLIHRKRVDKAISYFDFKIRGEMHFVKEECILYVEFSNKKPILHTQDGTFYLPRTTVNQLLDKLNSDKKKFIRCRRGSIVNIQQIAYVKKQDNLNYVVLNNGTLVPIGDKYKDEVYKMLRI